MIPQAAPEGQNARSAGNPIQVLRIVWLDGRAQCKRMIDTGAQMVCLTVPSLKEEEPL